jgi:hypothetical protein
VDAENFHLDTLFVPADVVIKVHVVGRPDPLHGAEIVRFTEGAVLCRNRYPMVAVLLQCFIELGQHRIVAAELS